MEKQFVAAGGVSFAPSSEGLTVRTRDGDRVITATAEVAGALGDLNGEPLSMASLCRGIMTSPQAIRAFGTIQAMVTQFVRLGLVEPVVTDSGEVVARLRTKGRLHLTTTPVPPSFRLSRHVVATPENGGLRLDSGLSGGSVWVAGRVVGDVLGADLAGLSMPDVAGLLWQAGLCTPETEDGLEHRMWNPVELLAMHMAADGAAGYPYGGTYRFAGEIAPPPLEEPEITIRAVVPYPSAAAPLEADPPYGEVVRTRESRSDFSDGPAPTLADVTEMLRRTTTIREHLRDEHGMAPTRRYVPSGGGIHEVDLYLAVRDVDGLEPGLYRNDPVSDSLQLIETAVDPGVLVQAAGGAFYPPTSPSFVVLFVARFDRLLWKYQGVALSLVLKHVGILTHALHLGATVAGIGACAQGGTSTSLFESVTGMGLPRHGLVGQMSFGPITARVG